MGIYDNLYASASPVHSIVGENSPGISNTPETSIPARSRKSSVDSGVRPSKSDSDLASKDGKIESETGQQRKASISARGASTYGDYVDGLVRVAPEK